MTEDFFRDRLRFLRNELGISAREMSIELGQNESYINKLETGKTSTSIESFLNICDFLQISPADFFSTCVNNSITDVNEIETYIRQLSSPQTRYLKEFLKDLVKISQYSTK